MKVFFKKNLLTGYKVCQFALSRVPSVDFINLTSGLQTARSLLSGMTTCDTLRSRILIFFLMPTFLYAAMKAFFLNVLQSESFYAVNLCVLENLYTVI